MSSGNFSLTVDTKGLNRLNTGYWWEPFYYYITCVTFIYVFIYYSPPLYWGGGSNQETDQSKPIQIKSMNKSAIDTTRDKK